MSNNNETVAEIVKRVRRGCYSFPLPNAAGEKLKLVREIDEAHKREIGELKGERKCILKANESLAADNTRLRDEMAAKDAEIASLRLLVNELADELDNYPCHNCKHGSERCEWCGKIEELDALVAKAREVVK